MQIPLFSIDTEIAQRAKESSETCLRREVRVPIQSGYNNDR